MILGGGEPPVYSDHFDIYTGNANPDLARKICRYLDVELGKAEVFQFANENIFVKILDNVREKDVFLISSGGQVIRTETNTINRYSSGARGVIVMRLAECDWVVAIAAFREGLAEWGGVDDNDGPTGTPPTGTPAS